jgi:uncharacterized protein
MGCRQISAGPLTNIWEKPTLRRRLHRDIANAARPNSVYVDTSAWIAFFSARDQNHAEAASLFRQALARNTQLITSDLVIAEIHRLILHRVGSAAALQTLNRIESSSSVSIVFATEAHHSAAKEWLAQLFDYRLTYTDAVSFAIMKNLQCVGFLGFDSDYLAAGFHPWTP